MDVGYAKCGVVETQENIERVGPGQPRKAVCKRFI